jgi:hypothetical protein
MGRPRLSSPFAIKKRRGTEWIESIIGNAIRSGLARFVVSTIAKLRVRPDKTDYRASYHPQDGVVLHSGLGALSGGDHVQSAERAAADDPSKKIEEAHLNGLSERHKSHPFGSPNAGR